MHFNVGLLVYPTNRRIPVRLTQKQIKQGNEGSAKLKDDDLVTGVTELGV